MHILNGLLFALGLGNNLIIDRKTDNTILPLHFLIKNKKQYNNESFSLLVQHPDVDKNSQDEDGKTPLHCACEYRNYDALELLCNAGADVNIIDNRGYFPEIYLCGCYSEKEYFRTIIKNDTFKVTPRLRQCDLNSYYIDKLYDYCHHHPDLSKLLASKYTVSDLTTNVAYDLLKPFPAIHKAVRAGNDSFVKHALQCYPFLINYQANQQGPTLFYVACDRGGVELAYYLLKMGADPTIANKHNSYMNRNTAGELLKSDGSAPDLQEKIHCFSYTTLHKQWIAQEIGFIHGTTASEKQYLRLKELFSTMSFLQTDHEGNTPLHHAIRLFPREKMLNILAAQVLALKIPNKEGITPIHLMLARGYSADLFTLVKNMNQKNNNS